MRRSALMLFFLTPTLVGVFAFGVAAVNADKVIWGTMLAGKNIGGNTFDQTAAHISERSQAFEGSNIEPLFNNNPLPSFTPAQTGLSIEQTATLEKVWREGRQGNFFYDFRAQFAAFFAHRSRPPVLTINESIFQSFLDQALAQIDVPARDATLVWDEKQKDLLDITEREGLIVDRIAIRNTLTTSADILRAPSSTTLLLIPDIPEAITAALPETRQNALALFEQFPRTLQAGDVTLTVDKNTAAKWFRFLPNPAGDSKVLIIDLDPVATDTYFTSSVTPKVDREPVNAQFAFKNGRVTTFALARTGQKLDAQNSIDALSRALFNDMPPSPQSIVLSVAVTKPEIGNDAAEELGIRERISIGETDFKGSPANRMHNIRTGTSRYNGVLIKPGEEFSFNTLLGAVGPETGYKPELVIKQNQTIPEYGGGLCQVSTTTFRAAAEAGLKITERRNHAFIVRYYNPPGFDATIYPPHPDFRFINDTPGHILIQTSVVDTKLRFEFFGTSDGLAQAASHCFTPFALSPGSFG